MHQWKWKYHLFTGLVSDAAAILNQENVCYLRAAKNIPVWNEIKSENENEPNSPPYKRFISSVCANKMLNEAELKSKLRLPLINNKKLMMLNILWGSREEQIPHGNSVYDECVDSGGRNFLRGSSKVAKWNQFLCFRFEPWCWVV